jgi:membrane-associated phospholipid phosphatase
MLALAAPTATRAQQASARDSTSPAADTSSQRQWITKGDAALAGTFALGALVVSRADHRLALEFQRPSVQRRDGLRRFAAGVRAAGDPGALLVAASAYALGRVMNTPGLADAGLHATESVLVSGALTGVLKLAIGRARPVTVHDGSASDFHPFSTTGGYTSFPSGHTTVAFAAAATFSEEVARSAFAKTHPRIVAFVRMSLYSGAAAVGLSRMYHDAHWGSDVVVGAGIGTVTSLVLVRATHTGIRNRVDRWLLPSRVQPSAGGVLIGWSIEQ